MPRIFAIDFLFLLPNTRGIDFQLARGYFVSLITVMVIYWLCFSMSEAAAHTFLL